MRREIIRNILIIILLATLFAVGVDSVFAEPLPSIHKLEVPTNDLSKKSASLQPFLIQSDCIGVDLVMVVDQSGSMDSYTDKEGFRSLAAQNILQRFATNALLECPSVMHRIAILNFGGTNDWTDFGRPDDPGPEWIEIGGFESFADPLAWQEEWLNAKLRAIHAMDMGDTDSSLALSEAGKLFSKMGPLGDSAIPRRQAVIMVTDGLPYGGSNDTKGHFLNIFNEISDNYENIVFWIVALKNTESNYMETEQFPYPSVEAWAKQKAERIKADPSPANNEDYWLSRILRPEEDSTDERVSAGMLWSYLADTHDGELVNLEKNRAEVPNTLNVIYENLLGREGFEPKCNEPFYVNAYIQSANLTFTKNKASVSVELEKYSATSASGSAVEYRIIDGTVQDASGNVLEDFGETKGLLRADGRRATIRYWSKIGEIEHYVITRPEAGKWMVKSDSCNDIRVRYLPLNATVALVYPTGVLPPVNRAPFYDTNNPTYFEVQVAEIDGTPFQVNGVYPLTISILYTGPDGLPIQSPEKNETWELLSMSDGNWRSSDPVPVPQIGNYGVYIRGTTTAADPAVHERVTVFEKDIAVAFRAPDVNLFDFRILTPQTGEILPLNAIKNNQKVAWPINVAVQLTDIDGQIVSDPQSVINGNLPFRAVLINEENEELESVHLRLDGTTAGDPVYVGVLRASNESKLDPEGYYQIRVDLTGEWRSESWLPTISSKVIDITRTLREGIQLELMSPNGNESQYAGIIYACSFVNQPADIKIVVRLKGLDGQTLHVDQILQSTDLVNQVLQGELHGPARPDGKRSIETLSFVLENDSNEGQQLVAYAGHTVYETGIYDLSIRVNQNTLNSKFVKPEPALTYSFERNTDFFRQASFCNISAGLLALLIVGLTIFIVWLFLGPLHGQFYFSEIEGNHRNEIGSTPAYGLINRRWLNLPSWASSTLKKMEIGRLKAVPWIDEDTELDENDKVIRKKEWRGQTVEIQNRRGEVLLGFTSLADRQKSEFTLDDERQIEIEYRE